jgi:hypothetical protein
MARWTLVLAVISTALPMQAADSDRSPPTFDRLVAQLSDLGLLITSDRRKIGEATSEAAYFMFADRKEHRPKCGPLVLPEGKNWLADKRVFGRKADRERVYPLFNQLVELMGYNEVCIYAADVHYGVNSHANFKLYKLGYRKDDARKGKRPEILLGDADYVINLP